MAARKVAIRQDEQTRAKIQAALIIGRLQDCVSGKLELTPVQVSAAKILLGKTLPDLQSVDNKHSGADGGAILFQTVYDSSKDN